MVDILCFELKIIQKQSTIILKRLGFLKKTY